MVEPRRSTGIIFNTRRQSGEQPRLYHVLLPDRSTGIIFNTCDINCVIAKNCNRYRADTHRLYVQFCGNLPLFCASKVWCALREINCLETTETIETT